MKRAVAVVTIGVLVLLAAAVAQEKGLKVKDLPPAVQKTVQEQLKGAELKGLSQATEKGKTIYELETTVNGKGRDLLIDATGAVLEVEEATTLEAIPPAAKAAIEKAAAGGRIKTVEILTKGGKATYEAAITKGGKNSEVQVTADGAVVK